MKRTLQIILLIIVSVIALNSCKDRTPTFTVYEFDNSQTKATGIKENWVYLEFRICQPETGNNRLGYYVYMAIADYPEYFKGEERSNGWSEVQNLGELYAGNFTTSFSELVPNTTYYYAPYVSSDRSFQHSIIQGEVKSFTTSYLISSITYTATEKLPEVSDWAPGLHTGAFNVAIISHEFSNGTGTISFAGEVTTIGERAFYSCSDLTSIVIPNSVTTIGDYAFNTCCSLTSVAIPNSVTTIGYAAFADCYDLTTITIPNSVTTIGEYAFTWCKGLTSVTIGNSVTTIGNMAFYYCPKLTSITIPNSVTTIEEYAFGNCESLFDVYVSWTQKSQLPTLGEMVFAFCPQNATLHIPTGTKNIYENVDQWKDFGKIKDDMH